MPTELAKKTNTTTITNTVTNTNTTTEHVYTASRLERTGLIITLYPISLNCASSHFHGEYSLRVDLLFLSLSRLCRPRDRAVAKAWARPKLIPKTETETETEKTANSKRPTAIGIAIGCQSKKEN